MTFQNSALHYRLLPAPRLPAGTPMGWVELPPYFTAATEPNCDLANSALASSDAPHLRRQHRLEAVAAAPPEASELPFSTPTPRQALQATSAAGVSRVHQPVGYVDVYVDEFLLLAQTAYQKERVMRAMLSSAIDDVFHPVEPTDPPHRKEPASTKKMAKGDAYAPPPPETSFGMGP